MTFRHIVLFTLYPDADLDEAMRQLNSAKPIAGLISWAVVRSLDTRKGVVIVEDVTFIDEGAFIGFRDSAAHQEASAHMRQVADWIVGDFEQEAGTN